MVATATKRKAASPQAETRARVPLGVYTNHCRESSIVVKHSTRGVWYLTMQAGYIECRHCGDEHFLHDFPLALPGYPLLRAVRIYNTSELRRDDDAQKVMDILMRDL